MKQNKIASFLIIGTYVILVVFAVFSLFNSAWLKKISDPGKTTEARTFVDKANQEMYKNNWVTAAMHYEQALEIDNNNREIVGNLGIAYTKLNLFSKARKCFDNVKSLSQGLDSMAYFNYYESMGSLEKAIGDDKYKSNIDGGGHYTKALIHYKKAISYMPFEPVLHYKYAYLLMKMNQDSLAINNFKTGIFKSENLDTYYYSALLTEYLPAIAANDSNVVKSIEELYNDEICWDRFDTLTLESFRKKDLQLANAYYNLGRLYYNKRNINSANIQFNKALQINPRLRNNINQLK